MRSLLCSLIALAGCGRLEPVPDRDALQPGDRVVTRWHGGFVEATVVRVRGRLVTVAVEEAAVQPLLPRDWVVRVDEPCGEPAAGEWRLCAVDDGWQPCRADLDPSGARRFAFVADGAPRIADGPTLPVPPGLRARVARDGERSLDEVSLAETLPRLAPAAAGQPVRVGDAVIARWSGSSWWDARVAAVRPRGVVVVWEDGGTRNTLTPDEVAPRVAGTLADGAWAMCRQAGTQWQPARVRGGAGAWTARYGDRRTAAVAADQCVVATVR